MRRDPQRPKHRHRPVPVTIFVVLGCTLVACSSGSSANPGVTVTPAQVTVPTGDTLVDVPVVANQTTRVVYTHAIPPTTISAWRPNLGATLGHLHVTIAAPPTVGAALELIQAAVTESVSVMVHIGPGDQRDTVCTTGVQYGPYAVGLGATFLPTTVTPATATADPRRSRS
jgi:hypothetical protein